MFKVPGWEDDVPTSNAKLRKTVNIKKQQKKNRPKLDKGKKVQIPTKQNSNLNSKDKKRKCNGAVINIKQNINSTIDISKVDTENADEVILNAKKKKFYEPIVRDDVEDLLFREVAKHPTTMVPMSSTGKQIFKIINKKLKKNKNERMKNKKNKQAIVTENEPRNVFRVTSPVISQPTLTENETTLTKKSKKEKIRAMLEIRSIRNSIPVSGNKLRERMLDRLKAAQFRYLNEKLYTSSGSEAKQLFQSDPAAFRTYHAGYQQQVKKWPVNPLDLIVKRILRMPKTYTIADMGCGEAALSARVPHAVRSFDLVSSAPGVETCDMAHTPLLADSTDVAVYCLALMGTDLTQYLVEANRVLKMGGHLLIAEVESRFDNVDAFTNDVMKLGFKLKHIDKSHTVFFFMEFVKIRSPPVKKSKLPTLTLKPCLYKRR